MDKECSRTTTLVLGLLEKFKFLSKGHCLYMDNYYSSPELFEELYFCETYAHGTVYTNRKGMPGSIKNECKTFTVHTNRKGMFECIKK